MAGTRLPILTFSCVRPAIYRQTISAFNGQLFTLAGAGVRLIIEGICNERKIADGPVEDKVGVIHQRDNLQGRINGLAEKNLISLPQAKILHQIRFLGNDSAHDLYLPPKDIVGTALDIAEHILEQVYEQPEKAKMLAKRKRPKRKRK